MPAWCSDDAPAGEKVVYAAKRGSEAWLRLHSLSTAGHLRHVEGEADFVVIVPDAGILVIEIKSHQTIDRRLDCIWRLSNDPTTARGPFQQASEIMPSLHTCIAKRIVDLRSIPIFSAAWVTSVEARTSLSGNSEWHDWQVLHSDDVKSAPAVILLPLAAGITRPNNRIKHFSYVSVGPDSETAARIAKLVGHGFELATVAGNHRSARESLLFTFIKERRFTFEADFENDAALFSEPAGSGKPFLAIEVATDSPGRLLCPKQFLHIQPRNRRFGRQGDVIDFVFRQHPAGKDLSRLLATVMREFKADSYELNEIVVWILLRDASIGATTTDPWLQQTLRQTDGRAAHPGPVYCSTIHAPKGLEAPAVVVTDLDATKITDSFDSSPYAGIIRATDRHVAPIASSTLHHAVGGTT